MILKKMIVDNQEIHVQISKDEAIKCHLNQEPLIFTDEQEKQDFYSNLSNKQSQEESKPNEQKHSYENRNYEEKPKKKTMKLMQILPFLDDDNIHDLFQKIMKDDESVKDLNLPMILPFLDEEDASDLFEKAFYSGNSKYDPMLIAPFVSEEKLGLIVDQYIEGKISSEKIDQLYPFLSREDLNRLFKHIIANEE
ncbi:MAG: hypothetical protein AB7V00_06120 [Bacilli bacterium]